ncbi:hypothetical protein [Aliirhizobium cellulosilyticum]|uniref:Uncharacterized protein n=1 Tax=Aliirhizobium cellulosilyticum TaxID=393664 RepID=A0A7W6XDW9_9HYPH|nr:hypothetical protein [Rhizobium cellulosilyticum]MBB4351036.1 hypothetical protein [Rhizobium cellulosilyticum]MBB4414388.1 hypothetical protein [Rhizobium cellulosilyticum]MBB4449004.1 hypothetical protein [Rhizobium cellulosilyticum]
MGTLYLPVGNAVRPHVATVVGTKSVSYDDNGNRLADGTRKLIWPALALVTQSWCRRQSRSSGRQSRQRSSQASRPTCRVLKAWRS